MLVTIIFIVAMCIGVPIAFMLGLSGFAYILTIDPDLMISLPQRLFVTANNYGLLAIPLFILAGELMELSGDVARLLAFSRALVGSIKGGLAYVMVIVGFLLGGPLGSANAEAALLSSTLYPEMKKDGYNEEFTAGLIAAVSVLGPLIPPGMLMVIYGVASGVSIADLFLAGIMPGVYLALALGAAVFFMGRWYPYPATNWLGWGEVWRTLKGAFFSIAAPIAVLVAIAVGICTPTEAAAVASVLTLLIGTFVYRKIKPADLIPVFVKTGVLSGSILIIGAMGGIFGWTLAMDRVPVLVADLMLSLTDNPYVVLLLINILLYCIGMFMDAVPAVMILVPVFMPIIKAYHFDPIHFGLLVCFNLTIGLMHPPVGTVFNTTLMATGVKLDKLIISIWWWVFICFGVLLFVTYVPSSVMFLPHMFTK
jgi:tripartite ATP-independent transporter DctM subunit